MDNNQRLQALIALASADGELAEKERQYIISIGLANHMMVAEILPLFSAPAEKNQSLVADKDKEEVLFQLIQLMRIDEKIYKTEMRFCAQAAAKLGFREEAVFELMLRARELDGASPGKLREVMTAYKLA